MELLLIILLVLALGAAVFFARKWRHAQEQINREEVKVKIVEARHQLLKTQLNPHFLFNSLNGVQNLILEEKGFLAQRYLAKFSVLMRHFLRLSEEEFVPLEDEVNAMNLYLELEQLRSNNTFDFFVKTDPDLDDSILIPPLLSQVFVENALVHAVGRRTDSKGLLILEYSSFSDTLVKCLVTDNGSGDVAVAEDQKYKKQSYGIGMVKERLDLLANQGNRGNLKTTVSQKKMPDGGTQIELFIPIK